MFIDDKCDEDGIGREPHALRHLHDACIRTLQGTLPNRLQTPLTRSLQDIRDRLHDRMPDSWMARFTKDTIDYFEANQWEANNRARRTWPAADIYIQMRPFTGALYTVFDLIEMSERVTLPVEIREDSTIRRLMGLSSNVVCWHNDIASIHKEHQHGDVHNLALILHATEGLTLQDAVNKVGRMADAQVHSFIAEEKKLRSFGSPEHDAIARRFVLGLQRWMRANLDWSFESGRFVPQTKEPIEPPTAMLA